MAIRSDIYGSRVGQIPSPDPFGDLSKILPALPGLNTAGASAIMSKLRGKLSPETRNMMQNYQASTAVRSGMPGANTVPGSLHFNRSLRDIGRTVEDVQSQGVRELLPFLSTLSATQTANPALQYERNLQNALNLASPEPSAAGMHAEELFNKYLNMLTNPAGGTTPQVGMPTYSFGPRTTPGRSAGPSYGTPQRTTSGNTGSVSAGPGTTGSYEPHLWDDPRFGAWGFSGVLPASSRGGGFMYAGPQTDAFDASQSNFYAGPAENYLPPLYPGWELDALESGWATPTPEVAPPAFDPMEYYVPPVMF